MNKPQDIWHKQKSNLLASINETIKKGTADKETLEVMRELLENVKVRKKGIEDYFNDLEQEE